MLVHERERGQGDPRIVPPSGVEHLRDHQERDEEPGVETYSVLWGRRNAVLSWLGAMLLAATGAWVSADRIGLAGPIVGWLAVLMLFALSIAWRFLHGPSKKRAKRIEHMSGLWTLLTYLGLAVAPFV